jgi:hypothetical protein
MTAVLTQNKSDLQEAKAPPKPHRSWWRLASETMLYLVLFTALLEGYFAIAHIGQQEFLQPDPEFGVKHIPNKLVTWRMEGYSSEAMSSVGLRDTEHSYQKPPGVYRIALLGDSATEGLQVSLKDTYGKALERMLNNVNFPRGDPSRSFEVINFGCSSYSTGQQLEQYRQQVLKYNPDAVVLMYNRGDSFENVIKPGVKLSAIEPRPYFYLDDKNALCQDKSVLQANQDKLRPHPLLDFLRAHSRIYGVFSQAHLSLTLNDSRYRKLDAWLRSTTGSMFRAKSPDSNTRQQDACAPRSERLSPLQSSISGNAGGTPAPPEMNQDPLKVTLALVHALASEAKSHGQLFIFMMFPNTIGDPDVARQQKQLKSLADQDAFDFIDLLPPFQNADPDADFIQIHFSPIGHRRVALMLANLFHNKLSLSR